MFFKKKFPEVYLTTIRFPVVVEKSGEEGWAVFILKTRGNKRFYEFYHSLTIEFDEKYLSIYVRNILPWIKTGDLNFIRELQSK